MRSFIPLNRVILLDSQIVIGLAMRKIAKAHLALYFTLVWEQCLGHRRTASSCFLSWKLSTWRQHHVLAKLFGCDMYLKTCISSSYHLQQSTVITNQPLPSPKIQCFMKEASVSTSSFIVFVPSSRKATFHWNIASLMSRLRIFSPNH